MDSISKIEQYENRMWHVYTDYNRIMDEMKEDFPAMRDELSNRNLDCVTSISQVWNRIAKEAYGEKFGKEENNANQAG